MIPFGRLWRLAGQLYRFVSHEPTSVFSPNTIPSSELPSLVREYITSLPSRRERTRLRSRRVLKWCETKACLRPEIHDRSQTYSSLPSRNAVASISLVGSENARARSAAL